MTMTTTNEVWFNLATKNMEASRNFYTTLGFEINQLHTNENMLGLFLGKKKIVLNIFSENMFSMFIDSPPQLSNEVLITFSANSPEEIDEWAKKVVLAGGKLYSHPEWKDGWLYGFGFSDPDGHRWNPLYMTAK